MSDTVKTPGPGVYRNIEMETYHRWDAASNSRLSLIRRSPAHLKADIDNPGSFDSAAYKFGRAAHVAILEPDFFYERYRIATKCVGITGKGAQCSKLGSSALSDGGVMCTTHLKSKDYEGMALAKDVEVLLPAVHVACLAMRDKVASKLRVSGLIAVGDSEVSIVWTDPETGLLCKGRIDHWSPSLDGGTIVDVKTTIDASRDAFERAIFNYGYNRQASFYTDGAAEVGLDAPHYSVLAIEKEPPYECGAFRLTEGAIDAGRDIIRPLMRLYARCKETDEWHGYPDEVRDIALPTWAWKKVDDELQEMNEKW